MATAGLLHVIPQVLDHLEIPVPTHADLVGFSQGAHATMALADHLSATTPAPFEIRTVIGIAGPYVLSEVDLPALVAGTSDPMVRSLALTRLTLAAELTGATVDDMYAQAWHSRIHELFDGSRTDMQVVTSLPEDPRGLFTDSGWLALSDPTSEFGQWAARASAVCDGWGTGMTVTLMHADGDTSALPRNTELCADRLTSSGALVTTVSLGDLEHIPSGERGIDAAAEMLSNLDQHS
ncbi:hypothetical protein [Williamsia sp.]|uniref:hypothetical protein n=1 Tax=Williamsia sp. TaxID=1872085 RepID=UPI001A340C77|nr:hypothetical protein [Williamsia sp.]MBJ7291654.1 hypothetical protein [Williamsia sp.]